VSSNSLDFPILEYDSTPTAFIEPGHVHRAIDIPQHCVVCFFQDTIARICAEGTVKTVKHLHSEIGDNPIYELNIEGQRLAVVHPGVGAPLAAAFLEELIAFGCTKFIACGGAGVLNSDLAVGHVMVPTSAVRDEGTSYHYLPPSREVSASTEGIAAIEQVLTEHHVDYVTGKTWTTDAIYRETPARIAKRKQEGCLTVEMEAAAFFAVAQFRKVIFAQMLYGGDDLSSEAWDSRQWDRQTTVRDKLFWLAAEACLSL
jgi:uridine phosphorylase